MGDKLSKELNAEFEGGLSKCIHIIDKELDLLELLLWGWIIIERAICIIKSEGNQRVLHFPEHPLEIIRDNMWICDRFQELEITLT